MSIESNSGEVAPEERPVGVFLPIITPFLEGRVDLESYRRLVVSYIAKGVNGIVPLGTTGEAPTVEEDECLRLIEVTLDAVASRVPVYVGISSNSTRKATKMIRNLADYPIKGFLVTSPYYNLPSQRGIYDHFVRLSNITEKQIIIYNIPYRTGRNVENQTVFELSKIKNICGIKDSCGNVAQSIELLRERDPHLAVLTGEDILFYFNIVHGGDGGILASAHLQTDRFVEIFSLVQKANFGEGLRAWNEIAGFIPLLFKEPNPAPIKYVLFKKGLIKSEEVREPLTSISEVLRRELDNLIAREII